MAVRGIHPGLMNYGRQARKGWGERACRMNTSGRNSWSENLRPKSVAECIHSIERTSADIPSEDRVFFQENCKKGRFVSFAGMFSPVGVLMLKLSDAPNAEASTKPNAMVH